MNFLKSSSTSSPSNSNSTDPSSTESSAIKSTVSITSQIGKAISVFAFITSLIVGIVLIIVGAKRENKKYTNTPVDAKIEKLYGNCLVSPSSIKTREYGTLINDYVCFADISYVIPKEDYTNSKKIEELENCNMNGSTLSENKKGCSGQTYEAQLKRAKLTVSSPLVEGDLIQIIYNSSNVFDITTDVNYKTEGKYLILIGVGLMVVMSIVLYLTFKFTAVSSIEGAGGLLKLL